MYMVILGIDYWVYNICEFVFTRSKNLRDIEHHYIKCIYCNIH